MSGFECLQIVIAVPKLNNYGRNRLKLFVLTKCNGVVERNDRAR